MNFIQNSGDGSKAEDTCPAFIHQNNEKWDSALPIPRVGGHLSAFLVAIAATLCFINSLNGNFVFDDAEAIVNNKDLRPDTPISNLLQNDFWGSKLTSNASHKSYRPVTVLSFRWNFWVADGLFPYGFHFVNIVLHVIVSVLALPVVNKLCGGSAPRFSFLTSLMFAVHPIHTEAVAGVVGRADLLNAMFSFLCFLSYAAAAGGVPSLKGTYTINIIVQRCFFLIIAMVLCALALFSKEQGITAIGICSAYDVLVVNKINLAEMLRRILKNKDFSWSSGNMNKELISRHGILVISGVFLLYLRWLVMGSQTPSFQEVDNPASFAESFWTRVRSYNYTYALNAWLLICPEWLCFDWSMGCIPLVHSIWDVRLLSTVIFWMTLLSFLWRAFTCTEDRYRQCLSMALVVLVVPFLPATNLIFRVGFVLAERVLYISSLGFCMLVALGLRQFVFVFPQSRWVLLVGYIVLILGFCSRSVHRSSQWIDEDTLFRSGLNVCPLNAKVHYNVAKNAGDNGNLTLAIHEYRVALSLNPNYEQAMNNLANILKTRGELAEAESLLRQAIELRPDFAAAWMNLGIVLAVQNRQAEAEKSYLTALSHRSHYPDCYYNLGNLYLNLSRHNDALAAWRNATKQNPASSIAWSNMIVMLDRIGATEHAVSIAKEAILALPFDPNLHFNVANVLGKRGEFLQAEQHFLRALELDPQNAVYHSNIGVLYHRWKKYKLAETSYLTALHFEPKLKSARDNLDMLKKSSRLNL